MTINAFFCDRPEGFFSFLIIARRVVLKLGWRIYFIWLSSPRSGRSRVKVYVLRRCSLPKIFTAGNMSFSPLIGVNTSFVLSLRAWSSDASFSSNSSMSPTIMSPFQIPSDYNAKPKNFPGKTLGPSWCNLDWSFAEIGWYSPIAPNGVTCPSEGVPNRLS